MIPTRRPYASKSGPPEEPGEMGAVVWMTRPCGRSRMPEDDAIADREIQALRCADGVDLLAGLERIGRADGDGGAR